MRKGCLIVPAYNEELLLGGVLQAAATIAHSLEIVIVDDGSHDATAEVAAKSGARVLRHPFNLGYGAALQTGYKYAFQTGAEIVAQMDADGQHDPRYISTLVEPIERDELDLVIGSRFLQRTDYQMGVVKNTGRQLFQALARGFGLRVTDPTSGLQAMNRDVLSLYVNDFFPTDFPDVDVLLMAHRAGLRIGERPVEMAGSPRASSLHSGWAPVYYVYKMLLSTLAGGRMAGGSSTFRQLKRDGEPGHGQP